MLDTICKASRSDSRLAALLDEAREYAQVYRLAKQRHKGCQGTGELMTLKEEFRDAVEKMVRHCREQHHSPGDCNYDLDALAALLEQQKAD